MVWEGSERKNKRAKSGCGWDVGEGGKEIRVTTVEREQEMDGGWLMKEGILELGDGASPKQGW